MAGGGFNIEVLGLGDVEAQFAHLPEAIQARILTPALRAGAKVFQAAAVAAAPRFTGALAEHFTVRSLSSRRKGVVKLAVLTGKKSDLGIPETTKSGAPRGYYPTAIMYGWRPGNRARHVADVKRARFDGFSKEAGRVVRKGEVIGQGFRRLSVAEFGTRKVPPNPFMRRAFEASKSAALAAVADAMRQQIPRVLEKALAKSAAANAAAVAA